MTGRLDIPNFIRSLLRNWLVMVLLLTPVARAWSAELAHVETCGVGPVEVVLIPCGGCDWRSWEEFMRRNRQRYSMHAVTLLGFDGSDLPNFSGDSKTPFLDYSASAITEYIESLQAGPVVVLGHSVGAIVALKTAIGHPDLVSALILEDWGAVHPASMNLSASDREKSAGAAAETMAAMSEDDYYSRFSAMMSQVISDSGRAQTYIGMLRSGYGAARHGAYEMHVLDLRPHLRELKLPLLGLFAIYPGTDAGKRRKQVAELLAGAVNLELVWFENTSHWVHEEEPEAFDAAVSSFIRKL